MEGKEATEAAESVKEVEVAKEVLGSKRSKESGGQRREWS